MKQGTNFVQEIMFDIDLDTVSSIEFLYKQDHGETKLSFLYPSLTAVRKNQEDSVLIYWTLDETYLFKSGQKILLDTRIHLKDSTSNPETPIIRLTMSPTLFSSGEQVVI